MADISKYLELLESPNKNKRYEACEELRVAEFLPLHAISALQRVTNDSDSLVADAARRALLVHSKETIPTPEPIISEEASFYKVRDTLYGSIEGSEPNELVMPSKPADNEPQVDKMMYPPPPWFDEGEDILVDEIVAPDVIGQPIEIYYLEPFTGYGLIIFFGYGIGFKFPSSEGPRTTNDYEFDAIAAVIWEINSRIGKKSERKFLMPQDIHDISYQDIQDISINGRTVEFTHSGKKPRNLTIRVGIADGERLYRELYLHYPEAVAQWWGTLQEIFGISIVTQAKTEEVMPDRVSFINEVNHIKTQEPINPISLSDLAIGAVSGAISSLLIEMMGGDLTMFAICGTTGAVSGAGGAAIAKLVSRKRFPSNNALRIICILGGVVGGFVPFILAMFCAWIMYGVLGWE